MIFGPSAAGATAVGMQVGGRALCGSGARVWQSITPSPGWRRRSRACWPCHGAASGGECLVRPRFGGFGGKRGRVRSLASGRSGEWSRVVRVGARAGIAFRRVAGPIAEAGLSESMLMPGAVSGGRESSGGVWGVLGQRQLWKVVDPVFGIWAVRVGIRNEPGLTVGGARVLHVPGAQVPKPPRRTARAATRCSLGGLLVCLSPALLHLCYASKEWEIAKRQTQPCWP